MRFPNCLGFLGLILVLAVCLFVFGGKAHGCDYAQAAFGCAPAAPTGYVAPQAPVFFFNARVHAPKAPQAPVFLAPAYAPRAAYAPSGLIQQDVVERRGLFGRRLVRSRTIFR